VSGNTETSAPFRKGRNPMSDSAAIADRVEIEALRAEYSDAAMMCDTTAWPPCSPRTG